MFMKFMITQLYVMNEYFQQLKWKKEGLCVHKVLSQIIYRSDLFCRELLMHHKQQQPLYPFDIH